jgi:excisionase family DNA binding protein
MGKKYLSIEEAAEMLGIAPSEVTRLREKGDIRAFADRGSWKFKPEDVEQLKRTRQYDSDPSVPLAKPTHQNESVLSDDEELGEQPTIIRKSPSNSPSDSDVRLIKNDISRDDSDDVPISLAESDSDVRLASDMVGVHPESDSDVQLIKPGDSLSDVQLVGQKKPSDSDSDVRLRDGRRTPDSEVKLELADSDSDVRLAPSASVLDDDSDSDVKLAGGSSRKSAVNRSDSDVRLVPEPVPKSSPKLAPQPVTQNTDADLKVPVTDQPTGDETVTFSLEDEGASVLSGDSGISLSGDSGIALEHVDDSGISLDHGSGISLDVDSGISLASGSDATLESKPSSVKTSRSDVKKTSARKQQEDDLSGTIPMMDAAVLGEEDQSSTQLEIPLIGQGEDSGDFQFEDKSLDDSETNVINLDDEEHADEYGATMVKKRGAEDEDLLDEGMFGEEATADADDIEVADDVVGEDDELEQMDVLGAADEDFGEVESGESSADYEAPAAVRAMPAPVEYEWGTGTFIGLVCATVVLTVTGTVMFDLIRNMWHADVNRINPASGMLLDALRGMFG